MMSRKTEIQRLKAVLLKRRDALRKALAGDLSALTDFRDQGGGDEVDFALDSAHLEMSSQLAEMESRELEQIEKALERMYDGTYGVCEVTGKSIPLERLRALPYTTVCVEAQRELERQRENPDYEPDWSRIPDMSVDFGVAPLGDFGLV